MYLTKTLLQKGIQETVFYCDLVDKFKRIAEKPKQTELLKSLILVINLKIILNVIKEWDTAWKSCDSLHAWL